MTGKQVADGLRAELKFFHNIIKDFKPEHGDFRPVDGMFTVSQQIFHVAYTAKWFYEGAFGKGFSMDFESMHAENVKPRTLAESIRELDTAYAEYIALIEKKSEEELDAPLPPNPIMPGPTWAVFDAQHDHTAHHRGALSVYLRLLGITPTMVYAD